MFLGLRTVTYPVSDMGKAKKWFGELLGIEPNFDEPFYVGFTVAGYELGLVPIGDGDGRAVAFWGVADADVALERLVSAGAVVHSPVTDVGDGIRVATVREPSGQQIGVIENPHFDSAGVAAQSAGPGK
jgi:predicted enzyme related to lactoylglutathione lyase